MRLISLLLLLPLLACGQGPLDDDDSATPSEPPPVCDEQHPDWTVGLRLCTPEAEPGYTLFAPQRGTTTYLIDLWGRVAHTWPSEHRPANSVYLLEDGSILRPGSIGGNDVFAGGGAGGRIERIGWDGELLWEFAWASDTVMQHHDVQPLPSGNVLVVSWDLKTEAEAIAAGRDPELLVGPTLWADMVFEVDPTTDEIVWEWHAWDHLVQAFDPAGPNHGEPSDHPGRIDVNAVLGEPATDWTHVNAVAYNAELDQIMLSPRSLSEIWVIDHGTSTADAAGPAGDLLYRWGNASTYGLADPEERPLRGQHDPHWIPAGSPGAGNLLIFNNRPNTGGSEVVEVAPPLQEDGGYALTPGAPFGPEAPVWSYEADGFFSRNISGAQRLPGGNTLICQGASGRLFEVTEAGELVWEYINPVTLDGPLEQGAPIIPEGGNNAVNQVFRATRIPLDHPGVDGAVGEGYIEGG